MLLAENTTRDVEGAFEDIEVAVVPVGSTEQHGPALPLCTDTRAATAVAEGASHRDDVVVWPPVPIGVSSHHRQFHGTLWVSDETFARYVAEAIENFTAHDVEKFVVVNGHGGNAAALKRLASDLYRDETAFVVPWNWWEGVAEVPADEMGEDVDVPGHAGAVETAMLLYLDRDLVRTERVEEAATEFDSRFDHPAFRGFDFADLTDVGSHGDPTAASAEVGEALYEASVASLKDLLDWLVEYPREDWLPRPHK